MTLSVYAADPATNVFKSCSLKRRGLAGRGQPMSAAQHGFAADSHSAMPRRAAETCRWTEEVLLNQPRIRFAEKGHTEGDDVYAAFGQTFAGRFLSVFFIYKLIQKRHFAKFTGLSIFLHWGKYYAENRAEKV